MSWLSAGVIWYAAHSDKVNPVVAAIGGAALVWAAIQQARTATNRHYEQTRADQQRRLTESFSKAVEQLASVEMVARLGGIYTLERLAIEVIAQVRSPPWWRRLHRNDTPLADPVSDLYWTVMETLTAFVRERARWKEPELAVKRTPSSDVWQPGTQSEVRPATDISAVLDAIRRRSFVGRMREKHQSWRFDLNATDLRGANLGGAYLEGAYLRRAHLEGAFLVEAHLKRANFRDAHLKGAHLNGAHLEVAYLVDAHLEGAHLNGAQLGGAFLRGAHLEGADLREAFLEGADLSAAIGDAKTRLPDGVARPVDWPPYAPF